MKPVLHKDSVLACARQDKDGGAVSPAEPFLEVGLSSCVKGLVVHVSMASITVAG